MDMILFAAARSMRMRWKVHNSRAAAVGGQVGAAAAAVKARIL
jgi:hypothetical protein